MRYCPPVWLSLIPYLQWSCFKPALAWNHVPSIQTDHVRRHWNNLHDQIGFDFNMLCIESWGTDESVNSEKTQAEQDAFPKAKRIQAHEINAWTTKNTTCRYGRVKRVGLLIQRSWVRSPDGMFIFDWSNTTVRMAEWSKAPDSRLCLAPLIGSASENSGPRMRAWVQIPLLTIIFFCSILVHWHLCCIYWTWSVKKMPP